MNTETVTLYRIEAVRTDGPPENLGWWPDREQAESIANGYWRAVKDEPGYLAVRVRKERQS